MFSLKFDLLFPSIDLAKAAARKLNKGLARRELPIEPRELRRIQEELRQARDHIRHQVTTGRFFL